jgi:hypothetical protein
VSRPYLRVHFDGEYYSIRWFCKASDRWREILRDFKAEFGEWEREFDRATNTWSVPLSCRLRVRQWADRWFSPDEREFSEDEASGYGSGSHTYSDTRSSYGRSGKTPAGTTSIEAAYARLHLLPSAPPELARAAHRVMVKLSHPDSGGSHEQCVQVNCAWEIVSSDLERRAS